MSSLSQGYQLQADYMLTRYVPLMAKTVGEKTADMKTFEEPILNQPIAELDFSKAFKDTTARHGLTTLADMLQKEKAFDLLGLEGFDHRMLSEFTHFLTQSGLWQYLR